MDRPTPTTLRIGDWCVNPTSGQISRDGETARVEVRTMRLLLCLAEHAGEVVSIDDLLNQVWSGVIVTPDSVYQAVASLRRLLGDDPKQPTYIATVPRLGYRMVATVRPWADHSDAATETGSSQVLHIGHPATISAARATRASEPGSRGPPARAWPRARRLCFLVRFQVSRQSRERQSLRPHPPLRRSRRNPSPCCRFSTSPERMSQEEFADGMTEELIDKLSKIPGLRVPAPTSSFYFKGKQIPIADVAKALGVAYVLDGSVRKSGSKATSRRAIDSRRQRVRDLV